ncbi:MAG TPA: N-acetyl sugar amidotransferase [Candidatus Nanoarchaeia archaeon]|nr:N-acetyl sugar amidotransferase [Candidatus Nanoarchaeia archaeon]
MENLKRCERCLLPETQETISYDAEGICNVCRQHEYKTEKIDWAAKKEELRRLIEEYRGKGPYDCIIPFSGGKDSTFTAYYLVKEFGIKPLIVSFDHGFYRPQVLNDTIKTLKKLGVDFHRYRPNWQVVKKLMLESLRRKGDFCWHCHTGVFAYPMQVAIQLKVPLLIWGEKSSEYTSYYGYDEEEEVDERRFNRYVNLGITAEDMYHMLDKKVEMRELTAFQYPKLADLRALKCRSICLGSYIPWDPPKHAEIIKKELGWRGNVVEGIPPEYYYEKIECYFQGVRDYLKFIKRGFGRTAHLVCLDLRNGRITKEKARELIEQYDGYRPASLDLFLNYLGISEKEFLEIALQHIVAPHKFDPAEIKAGKTLPDMKDWDKTFDSL